MSERRMALPDEPYPAYPRGKVFGRRWISTGEHFVLRDSSEGLEILQASMG